MTVGSFGNSDSFPLFATRIWRAECDFNEIIAALSGQTNKGTHNSRSRARARARAPLCCSLSALLRELPVLVFLLRLCS